MAVNDTDKSGFTILMACVDALPVLFFCAATCVLGLRLHSGLFVAGACICIAAGLGKVFWKLLIAVWKKDIWVLGAQLRYLMPVGFLLMIIGGVRADHEVVKGLLRGMTRMPSILFFVLALCGIAGLIVCSRRFDRRDTRGNWIEQCINCFAQMCVLIGVLLL